MYNKNENYIYEVVSKNITKLDNEEFVYDIEVKYINPYKGDEYVIVESRGNEYKYGMYEFFRDVLLKNNRYYYEKIDNNSFKNIN